MKKISVLLIIAVLLTGMSLIPKSEAPKVDLSPLIDKHYNYLVSIIAQPIAEASAEKIAFLYSEDKGYYPNSYGMLPEIGTVVLSKSFKKAAEKEGMRKEDFITLNMFDMSSMARPSKHPVDIARSKVYKKMRDIGRTALTPSIVKSLYYKNKDFILYYIKRDSIEDILLKDLEATIPYFDGSLNPTLNDSLALYFDRYWIKDLYDQEYDQCRRRLYYIGDLSRKKYGRGSHFAVLTYAWKYRRRMEHGDALVIAYGNIMKDLVKELKK